MEKIKKEYKKIFFIYNRKEEIKKNFFIKTIDTLKIL